MKQKPASRPQYDSHSHPQSPWRRVFRHHESCSMCGCCSCWSHGREWSICQTETKSEVFHVSVQFKSTTQTQNVMFHTQCSLINSSTPNNLPYWPFGWITMCKDNTEDASFTRRLCTRLFWDILITHKREKLMTLTMALLQFRHAKKSAAWALHRLSSTGRSC